MLRLSLLLKLSLTIIAKPKILKKEDFYKGHFDVCFVKWNATKYGFWNLVEILRKNKYCLKMLTFLVKHW